MEHITSDDEGELLAHEAIGGRRFATVQDLLLDSDGEYDDEDPNGDEFLAVGERRRGAATRVPRPRKWQRGTSPFHDDLLEYVNVQVPPPRWNYHGKLFVARYGVCVQVFIDLVEEMEAENWLGIRGADRCFRPSIPYDLRVMAWLRKQTRDETFDTISQLSGIGRSTLQSDFHKLCAAHVAKKKDMCVLSSPPPPPLDTACSLQPASADTSNTQMLMR